MLEIKDLGKQFGGVRAVDGLDIEVRAGEIFGLIGPNGSGKSTTVNLVCGVFPPSAGCIRLEGRDITRAAPHRRVAAGIARTFQNIRLFPQLSVWENLWVAGNSPADRRSQGFLRHWLGGGAKARAAMGELLEFSGLADKRDLPAGSLAFGEQRRLELARALATKPRLLLLDEPAAGMNLDEVGALKERILDLRRRGLTILLIEHVMELVMGVTDRIVVLNFGRRIAEGTPAEIQANAEVREAYLGAAH